MVTAGSTQTEGQLPEKQAVPLAGGSGSAPSVGPAVKRREPAKLALTAGCGDAGCRDAGQGLDPHRTPRPGRRGRGGRKRRVRAIGEVPEGRPAAAP